jgi:hypothetical protein
MVRALCYLLVVSLVAVFGASTPARAQKETVVKEPDHIRGQVTKFTDALIEVKTKDGKTVTLVTDQNLTVISLDKGSFTKVDFGTYVGSVAVKLNEYSPIVRDSLSWLHRGFELRVVDEKLRGIAVGHKKWSLTKDSVIAHGWVDDIEGRVLSVKYGPTEQEETDVEVGRGIPVLKMGLGDKSMIKLGKQIFAGAEKDKDGKYQAQFVFVGKKGIIPPL